MKKLNILPVLKFPCTYDNDSLNCTEMTLKVYNAMRELQIDYEKYRHCEIDYQKDFKHRIVKIMRDYIESIDMKMNNQNLEVTNAVEYMKTNLNQSITELISEMKTNGELDEIILSVFENLNVRIDKLENKKLTFNTIEELKTDSNLLNEDIVKTIGYYSPNDGGGATYKIRTKLETDNEDNGLIHYIGTSLVAELLINDVANIKQFGAKGDGIIDDAPFIRNAIAYLKHKNGGVLYIPKGIYYINSGDSRGLDTSETFSKSDYYTCFEIVDNMKVIGEGKDSVLLYNSNRLGYQLVNNKGDVGAIFSNIRVNGSDNYQVKGELVFKNFTLEYTELESGEKNTKDYIDGQLIRLDTTNNNTTQKYHDSVKVENLSILNPTGHQVFRVEGCNFFTAENVEISNMGKYLNSSNTDFSAFYINSIYCDIRNCSAKCEEQTTGTIFELHSSYVSLSNNKVSNIGTFSNVLGNHLENLKSTYIITNNICENVLHFVNTWVYDNRYLNHIKICNNQVLLSYSTDKDCEYFYNVSNDRGGFTANTKPVELLEIYDNHVETNIKDTTQVHSATYYNYVISLHNIKKINMYNNYFYNFRRSLINHAEQGIGNLEEIYIANNKIKNVAMNLPSDAGRYAININPYTLYGENHVNKIIKITDNDIDLSNLSGANIGILFNDRYEGEDPYTRLVITDNDVITTGTEVKIYIPSTIIFSRGVYFRHNYNNAITNFSESLVAMNCNIASLDNDSKVTGKYNDYPISIRKTGNPQYWIVEGFTNTQPTGAYFPVGSVMKNVYPTFTDSKPYMWVATVGGNPGTWKAVNFE